MLKKNIKITTITIPNKNVKTITNKARDKLSEKQIKQETN